MSNRPTTAVATMARGAASRLGGNKANGCRDCGDEKRESSHPEASQGSSIMHGHSPGIHTLEEAIVSTRIPKLIQNRGG